MIQQSFAFHLIRTWKNSKVKSEMIPNSKISKIEPFQDDILEIG